MISTMTRLKFKGEISVLYVRVMRQSRGKCSRRSFIYYHRDEKGKFEDELLRKSVENVEEVKTGHFDYVTGR